MENNINPQIVEIKIGSRNLRKIKIYPLTMGDQIKLTNLIEKGLSDFSESGDESIQNIIFITKFIEQNINTLFEFIVDEDLDKILKELTNLQLIAIAHVIWKVNYEDVLKNAVSLFQGIQSKFLLKRPLQPSVKNTDIDLSTSFNENSGMED